MVSLRHNADFSLGNKENTFCIFHQNLPWKTRIQIVYIVNIMSTDNLVMETVSPTAVGLVLLEYSDLSTWKFQIWATYLWQRTATVSTGWQLATSGAIWTCWASIWTHNISYNRLRCCLLQPRDGCILYVTCTRRDVTYVSVGAAVDTIRATHSLQKRVSEWFSLTAFLRTADIEVHIVHTSHVFIAYTLKSLSSLT